MDQTTRTHFSKISIPILVSISAFSIMFSFSFLLGNDFPNQMRRNFIFLFFNGILVLTIKSSGLARNYWLSPETKHEFAEKGADRAQLVVELTEHQEQASELEDLVEVEDDEDEYEDAYEDEFFVMEEEGFGSLSTEELNKKCDDFIRKMREEINFQAQ